MPNMNLNFQMLVYEDFSEKNPKIRMPDLTKDINGIAVQYDKSDRIIINPGETKDIAVTTRAVQWDNTTQLSISRPVATSDTIRLAWTGTGTAPVFRTLRSIGGDATTAVSISRVNPYVARIQVQSGTAWSLGSVQPGDLLRFEASTDAILSPFSAQNVGKSFKVQAAGSNYIDFLDNSSASLDTNITLGADFAYILRVTSTYPVKVNDTIELSGSSFNPANLGKFFITDVSSDFIEFLNPFGYPETVTYSNNSLFTIYEYLIGFVLARGTGPFKIKFGGQDNWAKIDKAGDTALMMASVSTYQIQAMNDGLDPVEISIQHCKINS